MARGAWVVVGPHEVGPAVTWVERATRLLEALAALGADVIVLDRWTLAGEALDGFVLAAALADATRGGPLGACALGVLVELGRGRAASVSMREVTTLDHLAPGRAAIALAGSGERLSEAAQVARGLLHGGPATAGGLLESVTGAPNLPPPPTDLSAHVLLLDLETDEARTLDGTERSVRRAGSLELVGSIDGDELVVVSPDGG